MSRNKDYDVKGEPTADKMEQIDEMFRIVFEDLASAGSSSGGGSVSLVNTAANYLTLAASVLTTALINLATHVTGRLLFANFTAATAPSVLLGRRSGSAGDFEEVTLGTGLAMSAGAVLSGTGESHTDGYWSPLTDGDTTQPELIFDSFGDAIMVWTATP